MARVKNPTKQGAIVASRSIDSSSVGEWIVFTRSNAMKIHTLWGVRSNLQISRFLCSRAIQIFVDHRIAPSEKESQTLSSVPQCSDLVVSGDVVLLNQQVEIDRVIETGPNFVDLVFSNNMANTKQMARKANNGQGTPTRFPSKGKPGGKAAEHMRVAAEDGGTSDDNESSSGASSDHEQEDSQDNQVQQTVRAGKRRRVWGGKARVYKRPKGVVRKYRPGIEALKEIRHYQREY